jgi:phospholipid/cholesterol/gamma-HCH transport system substrate-binding protein
VTGLAFVQLDDSGESKVALEATPDGEPARIPMRASLLSKLSDQGVAILARSSRPLRASTSCCLRPTRRN